MTGDVDGRGATRDGPGSGLTRPTVALFQPVLAHYRVDLFNAIDAALAGGLTVFTVPATASSRLGGADGRLNCGYRRSRTWRLGPIWWVPSTFSAVWARSWEVVVLSWNVRQVELLPVLLLARLRGVPVVLWGHGLGHRSSRASLVLRRWQAQLASAVVTYGAAGARDVAALVPGQSVHVLLNTVGRPAPRPSDALTSPSRRLVHLGRLIGYKHVDHLLEAVARLRREGLDLTVDIVGDGPARGALEVAAARLDLGGSVRWHGQVVEWSEVRSVVQRSDLVVLPARAGLAVVDAFAASRPVVVLDDVAENPPEAELVVDGDTGYRYRPCTVDALTRCLREIYADPEALVRTSERAGEVYRDRLGLDAAAASFARVVSEVTRRADEIDPGITRAPR